jgi:HlyD family secretion protein
VVKAKNIYHLALDFPAILTQISVEEGQVVKKDETLATLDITDYQAQVINKKYELAIAEAQLDKQALSLKQIENDLIAAENTYQKLVNDVSRQEKLYQEGVVTGQELEKLKQTMLTQEKIMDNFRLALENSQINEKRIHQQEIERLQSEVKQMENHLLKPYLTDNRIICPISAGVVFDVGYKVGDRVTPEKKILGIMDLESIIVEADVSEEFIAEISIGSAAAITPLANPAQTLQGHITRISGWAVEKKGETVVTVEISLDEKEAQLLPGFNVDVEIMKE